MEYIRVANQADCQPNKTMVVIVDGDEVLVANVDGSYYAIANKCTHAGGSLAHGILDGNIIQCPKHGARFDLTTGQAVGAAKIGFLKLKVKDEKCYTVKIEGTDILVGKTK
jgi:nitrite reductase/ring-hydroxylating ferredoxin subunit